MVMESSNSPGPEGQAGTPAAPERAPARIAIVKERAGEARVAAVPESVKKLVAAGVSVVVEQGAGVAASYADADYAAAGAELSADARSAIAGADILLKVRPPSADEIAAL